MSDSQTLTRARKAKDDEFYTLYEDIEKEVLCYPLNTWKEKIVYCNCDDPRFSNFWKYFVDNFHKLGLKALHATYKTLDNSSSQHWIFDGKTTLKQPLKGNGDFRSEECIEILKEADVVVTNPPFSLFRKFLNLLMDYKKEILVMGGVNNIKCRDTWLYIMDSRLRLGYNNKKKDFLRPDGSFQVMNNVVWFTTLTKEDIPFLPLTKRYNHSEYEKYDNYDAINVDKLKDIPCDYDGVMGVPITFIEKHNPKQFEIVGITNMWAGNINKIPQTKNYDDYLRYTNDGTCLNKKSKSLICGKGVLKGKPTKGEYHMDKQGNIVYQIYARIFIRHRKLC